MPIIELFGIKIATTKLWTLLAGFCGALVSLSFFKQFKWRAALVHVIAGTMVSHYVTPLIYYGVGDGWSRDGIAFLVGLFGLGIMAGIFIIVQSFRERPIETVKEIRVTVDEVIHPNKEESEKDSGDK